MTKSIKEVRCGDKITHKNSGNEYEFIGFSKDGLISVYTTFNNQSEIRMSYNISTSSFLKIFEVVKEKKILYILSYPSGDFRAGTDKKHVVDNILKYENTITFVEVEYTP